MTRPMNAANDDLELVHRFVTGEGRAASTTLLLLHGTGGDENDLLPLGASLLPGAAILSPRGAVRERGMPRFFARLSEGVFDLEDLAARTEQLIRFVNGAIVKYSLDAHRIVAVGFSNGANIAASVLLTSADTLSAAVLFRPMVPFIPDTPVSLAATRVFIGAGEGDPIVPATHSEQLAELLQVCGADVTLTWQPGGHTLTRADVAAAYDWLEAGREQD
jgi:predicted esterase